MISRAESLILAIDLGTTDLKAALVSPEGRLAASARVGLPLDFDPDSGRAEQDPGRWWAALESAVGQLDASEKATVAAICCVGQGPTLVAVDETGTATRAAITWMDSRPSVMAGELKATTGQEGWELGNLAAARWVELNDPDAARTSRWYLNSWEWAALRLTGEAARTRAVGQQVPVAAQLSAAGIAIERLPPIVDAGSALATVDSAVAAQLGLPTGIPVIAGMVDSVASFHGAGLVNPGDATDTGGTSGGVAVYADAPRSIPSVWVGPAPLEGRWILGGAMNATGRALTWLLDEVVGSGESVADLIHAASRVPAGAAGLLFLPYLAGERSPIWDPIARGAFVGLTLQHGRAHLARAVLEASAMALRQLTDPIAAVVPVAELRVGGGTARDDVWNQIKADVINIPIAVPKVTETAVLGAAVLAATAIRAYPSLPEAIAAMVRMDRRLEPNQAHRATYDALFAAYSDLWPAIAPVVHQLHELPTG